MISALVALAGLGAGWWAYHTEDLRTFGWAVVTVARSALARLIAGKAQQQVAPPPVPASALGAGSTAEIDARIAEYAAAKRAQYEKHVVR